MTTPNIFDPPVIPSLPRFIEVRLIHAQDLQEKYIFRVRYEWSEVTRREELDDGRAIFACINPFVHDWCPGPYDLVEVQVRDISHGFLGLHLREIVRAP